MNFKETYDIYLKTVEEWLETNIPLGMPDRIIPPATQNAQEKIDDAMKYSLMSGGKRIRPVLSLAVCDALNGNKDIVLPFACAIELIHTYSLIHDDLPCMDNDDYRRGKPTSHKVFGEAIAVLAGDGLLNMAFEIMLEEIERCDRDNNSRVKAARMISHAAGTGGMIGGQVQDIESEQRLITYEELVFLHQQKTGALFSASVLAPALLLDADENIIAALDTYAKNIGLAFQIKDDILDLEGDSVVVGKTTGSDAINNKVTYVSLLGLKRAKELLNERIQEALYSIKTIPGNRFLGELAIFIADRNK